METLQAPMIRRRSIGWYAVHLAHALDRLKLYRRRLSDDAAFGPVGADVARVASVKEHETQRLKEAVRDTHRILAQARSIFPLMLFPDTITVDRQKLTIVYKRFFGAHQTVGVPLENVKNIQADIGPFFGSLTITSDQFINSTQTITCLLRRDARNIQRLVQGITAAISEGIDLSKIGTRELKDLLCKLGEGHAAAIA